MFVFQQMYTRSEGSLLRTTLLFGLLTGLMRFPLAFALYGTHYTFHVTGVIIAALYAAVGIGTTQMCIRDRFNPTETAQTATLCVYGAQLALKFGKFEIKTVRFKDGTLVIDELMEGILG